MIFMAQYASSDSEIHQDRILVLDFGSQYTQLIARRLREIGVYSEVFPYDVKIETIEKFSPKGVILSGGPESVHASSNIRIPDIIFQLGVPVLGICYGMQAMADYFGGKVGASERREYGYARVDIQENEPFWSALDMDAMDVWMSHGDKLVALPDTFKVIACSENAPIAAMAHLTQPYFGLQFHPEVTHTRFGIEILTNFVVQVCGLACEWTASNIIENSVQTIRSVVGKDTVLLGLSGGVDSSVVAALLHKAIGQQLVCVFVDTGLLRLNEGDQVMNIFAEHMHVKVIRVNAEARFYKALEGVYEPEVKRKIIGKLFVDIFQEEAAKLSEVTWLAQGTIYPDVIESAGDQHGKAHVIKSHHNVGGLPKDMHLKLLEPLRELFKDEVRKIGLLLDLPYRMVYRHPFPGPGLGIRIIGEVREEYADILRAADAIFTEMLERENFYDKVSQAFVVFLPVKSVGVTGDQRKYDYVVVLRAVETIDFMTARWAHLPFEFIEKVSNRIVNEVDRVSRVVYDVTGKPPGTIEWE